jgi:hypothetical protein
MRWHGIMRVFAYIQVWNLYKSPETFGVENLILVTAEVFHLVYFLGPKTEFCLPFLSISKEQPAFENHRGFRVHADIMHLRGLDSSI